MDQPEPTALPTDTPTPVRARARKRAALIIGGTLTTAVLTGGGVLAAYAFFTSQATVTGQTVGTATVEITADTATMSAPIGVTDMLPGDTATTSIDLVNTGSEDVSYTVRVPKTTGGDAGLEAELDVTVTIGAATETRKLSAWQTGALQLPAALADGATQRVTVTVALPTTAGNALQGTSAGFTVQFDAIQARNTPAPTGGWVTD